MPITPALVLAQVKTAPAPEGATINATASCYDKKGEKLVGSRFLPSQVLVSPDGHNRAYAENYARMFKGFSQGIFGDATVPCANTSKLYVSGPKEERFRLVLLQEPTLEELGNSIQIVDWSPDSRYLLLMTQYWQYESDFGSSAVRVFDSISGVFTGRESLRIEKPSGNPCTWDGTALGFSPDGKVVARVLPTFDQHGDTPDLFSCVKKPELRAFDFLTGHSSPLPDGFRVNQYGRWQEQVSKKGPNDH
jgi:hypothetical protein